MDDAARAQEMWSQLASKNLESMTVWAEANQRMLKEWIELTSVGAKEGLRLCGELQVKALEGVNERLQVTAEQAGTGIQATLTDAVAQTKEIYARAA